MEGLPSLVLCRLEELCEVEKVGRQGEGGLKSETGRVYHASWCVVSTRAVCCDSEFGMA